MSIANLGTAAALAALGAGAGMGASGRYQIPPRPLTPAIDGRRVTALHILGLSASATESEIKSAYRRLAKTLHPDINHAPDATSKFEAVNAAYKLLTGNS